jgi:hypothetical protein
MSVEEGGEIQKRKPIKAKHVERRRRQVMGKPTKKAIFLSGGPRAELPLSPLTPKKSGDSFVLDKLSNGDLLLKLPISVNIKREGRSYYLSNDILNVYAFGESLAEAKREFESILKGLYLSFYDTPDEELTADAQALKGQLRAYLGTR